jgi:glycosyltransferase involved in cell wall biosynthesis
MLVLLPKAMVVHQLLPNFRPGDAMGAAAVAFRRALRRLGAWGELYAGEVDAGSRSWVRPASWLKPGPDDWVLYHHGIASPLASKVMHLECRRAVVFHNVTPARFYPGTRLAEPLIAGRAQLAALAPHVELSIGVSKFNAGELAAAGHRNVQVVPLFVEPQRFAAERADAKLLARLSQGEPRLVSVSRVVAHKRFEDLLALHEELLRIRPQARLTVVGAASAGNAQVQAVLKRAKKLRGVELLGSVSHTQLVAAYRSAQLYVSMSEHEGFGVPLVEAMAAEVPVMAYGAAAVPETMGGRGVVFDEKNFAALAEVAAELCEDVDLRERVIAGQLKRVSELSVVATQKVLVDALQVPRRAGLSLTPLRSAQSALSQRRGLRVGGVVQRFGEEISGGAEAHARQVALRLAREHKVTVLTSTALEHLSWANHFPPGRAKDGKLEVLRFEIEAPREIDRFNVLSKRMFGVPQDEGAEERWLWEQGPRAPGLLEHLARHGGDYDAFIFFTYLYSPTAHGLPLVSQRSLLVPTAHPEPPLDFDVFRECFELPRVLMCNTVEETALIRRRFPNAARTRVVGVGIDPKKGVPSRFAKRYSLDGPYLLYLGRREAGKGIDELITHHQALVADFHDAPQLVLAGAGELEVSGDRVKLLGRIDETDKWDALAGALAVVVPSRYESLSLVALEGFASGTPLIANLGSDVLAGHLERSGAGAGYSDTESFAEAVREVGESRPALSKAAKAYARAFQWEDVLSAYREELGRLGGRT